MKKYTIQKKVIESDGFDMDIYILKPTLAKKPKEDTPGILWIHGGGYVTGMAKMIYISRAIDLVKKYGAIVITPEYRLSKKAPYPAALNDCYAALKYLKEHADELGVNSSKIMVGGESAGGGLTVATCMRARDSGEVNIAFQMPLYPMIDDRDTESSKDNHTPVWNTKRNKRAWKAYLGPIWGKEVPSYAAPARQTNYADLPPAYTFVGDIEPFYCETLTYSDNLKKAGVQARVDIYHNWFHAYDIMMPFKQMSKIAISAFEEQYLFAVEHYSADQDFLT